MTSGSRAALFCISLAVTACGPRTSGPEATMVSLAEVSSPPQAVVEPAVAPVDAAGAEVTAAAVDATEVTADAEPEVAEAATAVEPDVVPETRTSHRIRLGAWNVWAGEAGETSSAIARCASQPSQPVDASPAFGPRSDAIPVVGACGGRMSRHEGGGSWNVSRASFWPWL